MAAAAYFIMAMMLFLQRAGGERSRIILAVLASVSVFNYLPRFFSLLQGGTPSLVISVPMLILAIFMVICYIMYPIEVISPGWINLKRLLWLYMPVGVLLVIYGVTSLLGVVYEPYVSLLDMWPHMGQFNVWFRVLLSFMIFLPPLCIFYIPYGRKYSNTDRAWIRGYSIVFLINNIAYILVLSSSSMYVKTGYYFVSVGCQLYIVYQELFVRIISTVLPDAGEAKEEQPVSAISEGKYSFLFQKLEAYMHEEYAWRDPELSVNRTAAALCTNRTTLARAIQEQGYDSYTTYVNRLRINEFLQQLESRKVDNFQDGFFTVGFRSKSTALRNFRQFTGSTPSEYVQNVLKL